MQRGTRDSDALCEGPVRMKSKLTSMFHLDSTADDAYRHIQCMNSSIDAGLKAQ